MRRLAAEHGEVTAAIDLVGGVTSPLTAMLLEAGIRVVHVLGLMVNRARRATKGGEAKSDPRDAKTIADQLRLRNEPGDWRVLDRPDDISLDLRLLVSRRRDVVVDQTRRLARLGEMMASISPGLEHVADLANLADPADLALLTRHTTPAEIRRAGRRRLTEHLLRHGSRCPRVDKLVHNAIGAAAAQRTVVPGEARLAEFIREMATEALEALTVKHRVTELNGQIAAGLDAHPDRALALGLPGMGATLAAELLAEADNLDRFASADQLASATGPTPVPQQSGKVRYLRRSTPGSKTPTFVFYQSAFCAPNNDPASKAFYRRKHAEGKRHHQTLIAPARPPINVPHTILRTHQPYQPDFANTTITAA